MQSNSFEGNPIDIAEEHLRLSDFLPMTNSEVECLVEILELIESDNLLSSLLDEVDEKHSSTSIFLDCKSNKYYREQQRKTIECLDAIDKKINLL